VRPASNVLDVVITALRQKLGPPSVVQTVRGVGYRCG
jgi:two-component system OmpR family response regulator